MVFTGIKMTASLSHTICNLKFHKNKTRRSRRCALRPDFPVTSVFFTGWNQGQSFISFQMEFLTKAFGLPILISP